jgi:ferritin-like metal-binding protein YciE
MKLLTLQNLYEHGLMDAVSAETQILETLPKMIDAATSPDLREAFEEHLEQTKEHKEKVEELISKLEERPEEITCKGMKGIIDEGEEAFKVESEPAVLDAALIGSAQKVEHYEIALYGTLQAYAELMDNDEAAEIFEEIKDQEIETDERLSELAISLVNPSASDEGELDDEDEE